jgi:uncharacterized protein (TIGR03083 family)
MDNESSAAFGDASEFFASAVALVPADGWNRPGLGSWDIRELVAHANRAQTLVVEYVESSRPPESFGPDYFNDEAIAARARDAARALGDAPAFAVKAAGVAAVGLIRRSAPETPVSSPMGTLTLGRYLPSRTTELVIHTVDLIRAIDVDVPVPERALKESLCFVAERSTSKGGLQVLLALTGRGSLPADFTIY